MPLSKLQNFIKNTEGKILYVNPNDIGATDSIENQGNSLSQPFKTLQRALLESARFSYVRGNDNDLFDRTTILLFPGEHLIDNRPGFKIKDDGGTAKAISPAGVESIASSTLTLSLDSVFDLDVEDNMLYKFNSTRGGCILPRGTAIVGLDLRKTKIRPLYVPNPTDDAAYRTDLIRLTGTCYFRDFTFFDGSLDSVVYTDPEDFGIANRSKPTFSHHKLTCFGFADGVNKIDDTGLTDLDMYYSKLSNAFNEASGRNIDQKFPLEPQGFSKSRIEWEIVGAFAADPIDIQSIFSGDGINPTNVVTVTTDDPHGLTVGTPIKIKGVQPSDYNISTFVQTVVSPTRFTYLLQEVDPLLAASGVASGADVTIETDTVTGASPYVFNVSLRSVFGMNGMIADGKTASGFRSMVVAQFTAVSLQKDDRAFVKYNPVSRTYDGITISKVTGAQLAAESSSTNTNTVYHLDSKAIYRKGWDTHHIAMVNDSIIQIVSVFAIGFNKHFDCRSGGDASITNSNSNFGQIALVSSGFKQEAFTKDDQGFITSIIAPQDFVRQERNIDLVTIDVGLTTQVGVSSHLYLFGFNDKDNPPAIITQGFRVGARTNDNIYVKLSNVEYAAPILISDNIVSTSSTIATGTGSKERITKILGLSGTGEFSTDGPHNLVNGEKVRILSEEADLPENLEEDVVYYAIPTGVSLFRVAATLSDATKEEAIAIYGGRGLRVESRVSDKAANDIGSPVLFDPNNNNWFIHVEQDNALYAKLAADGVSGIGAQTPESYIKRVSDTRALGDKIYKYRYFVPKEADAGRDPVEGFILQDSNDTSVRNDQDFTLSSINLSDHDFDKNPRYISTCSVSGSTVTVRADLPHNLDIGDLVKIVDVKSTTNTTGIALSGYNGIFEVTSIVSDKEFTYGTTDQDSVPRTPGDFTSDMNTREALSARYQKVDNKVNASLYRSEVVQKHIPGISDGIYHFNVLTANNAITEEFTDLEYLPDIERFFPQLDRDNVNTNPKAAKSFAKRSPIGAVAVDDPENSITRESIDNYNRVLGIGRTVVQVTRNDEVGITTVVFDREHNLSGIVTCTISAGGNSFDAGDYYNVKLLNDATTTWDGATARVTVGAGGAVDNVDIISGGSGYSDGETLDLEGFTGAEVQIATAGISTFTQSSAQLTGVGKTDEGVFRVVDVPDTRSIAIAQTVGDPSPVTNQYFINCGMSVGINTIVSFGGISTVTTNDPHGLISGSSFRILDNNDNNKGDYTVLERIGIHTFTISTTNELQTAPNYILPSVIAARGGEISAETESLGGRSANFYGGEIGTLGADIGSLQGDTLIKINLVNSGIATTKRFPIGSFIEIDGEIMRIASDQFSGAANDELTVIRGYLGSDPAAHLEGSLIRKINVFATELRRPSILRGSGHTFEYLGYGPGNYSTGLPQVQDITLTDREEFLTQSQKRGGGVVVYTAMNNDGDFFIGNKIINPSTGEESTFDAPIPSIRGEDPSVLSVIFDEVTVKQRLVVEGGASKTLLSQFNGPVSIDNVLNISGNTKIDANLEVAGRLKSSGSAEFDGSLNVAGVGTFGGAIDANGGAELGEIEIGIGASSGRIQTTVSDLTLKSATTKVMIEDDVNVDGNIVCDRITADNIIPVGGIIPWAGTSTNIPTGWFLCNGQQISKTTYATLYSILTNGGLQFPYGADVGGNFRLPNMTDRFVITAGSAYGRGGTGGSKDSVVISHNHTVNASNVGDHSHNTGGAGGHAHNISNVGNHGHNTANAGYHGHNTGNSGYHGHNTSGNGGHGHNTNNTGGHSHNTSGNGNHRHWTSGNGGHTHQYNRSEGDVEYGRRSHRSRRNSFSWRNTSWVGNHGHNMNYSGNHGHNTNNTGNHGHNVSNVGNHGHNVAQNGTHSHGVNQAGNHSHSVNAGGSHGHNSNTVSNHGHNLSNAGGHGHNITATAVGQSGTNRNLPPYFGMFYIIKAA